MRAQNVLAAMSLALALSVCATAQYAQNIQGVVLLAMGPVQGIAANTPLNGLTVQGVTFQDNGTATYDSQNGGQLTYTQDPVITGYTSDVLRITFPYPISDFAFGVSLVTQGTVTNAVTVDLLGAGGVPLGTYGATIGQPSNDLYSNGIFVSPANVGPITSAVVHFNTPSLLEFGFDNLTFSLESQLYSDLLGW